MTYIIFYQKNQTETKPGKVLEEYGSSSILGSNFYPRLWDVVVFGYPLAICKNKNS